MAQVESTSKTSEKATLADLSRASPSQILLDAPEEAWRSPSLENLIRFRFAAGDVWLLLAEWAAPNHCANIRALAREKFYDNTQIVRCHDNYAVQWGVDNDAPKEIKTAKTNLVGEFSLSENKLPDFVKLPDLDTYAAEVGFTSGLPVARSRDEKTAWLVHRYAMVGVSRGVDPDSGFGGQLFAALAPLRYADQNLTLVGRIIKGMEILSAMPRSLEPFGFYIDLKDRPALSQAHVASDLPDQDVPHFELLDTRHPVFLDLIKAQRERKDPFVQTSADRIDIANVLLPVRQNRVLQSSF